MKGIISGIIMLFVLAVSAAGLEQVQDFEGGVHLQDYDGRFGHQSVTFAGIRIVHDPVLGGSNALLLSGNTWKEEKFEWRYANINSKFKVWLKKNVSSEAMGVGVAYGSGNQRGELIYWFGGTQQFPFNSLPHWILATDDHVIDSRDGWDLYEFELGKDWLNAYGRYPLADRFVYINDNDADPTQGSFFVDNLSISPIFYVSGSGASRIVVQPPSQTEQLASQSEGDGSGNKNNGGPLPLDNSNQSDENDWDYFDDELNETGDNGGNLNHQIPEFSTIGAAAVLIGAVGYMFHNSRKRK